MKKYQIAEFILWTFGNIIFGCNRIVRISLFVLFSKSNWNHNCSCHNCAYIKEFYLQTKKACAMTLLISSLHTAEAKASFAMLLTANAKQTEPQSTLGTECTLTALGGMLT